MRFDGAVVLGVEKRAERGRDGWAGASYASGGVWWVVSSKRGEASESARRSRGGGNVEDLDNQSLLWPDGEC